MEPQVRTRKLEFDKVCIAVSRHISQYEWENVNTALETNICEDAINSLRVELRKYCLGKEDKVGSRCFKTIPKTLWQCFKHFCMPEWFNKWYPVKWNYEYVEITYTYICPHDDIKWSDNPKVHIDWLDGTDTWNVYP